MQPTMRSPCTDRSPELWLSAAALAGIVALTVWALWPTGGAVPIPAPYRAQSREPAPTAAVEPSAEEPSAQQRTLVASASTLPACDGFDVYMAELVKLGVATATAFDAGELDRAKELDERSKRVFAELLRCVSAPEEPALATISGMLSEDRTLTARVRRGLCRVLVADGLARRQDRLQALGERDRLDLLVSAILGLLPQDDVLAAELGGLLVDQPYLGVAHEPAVLELVAMVEEQPFLRGIATRLLRTLWRNLQERGARTSGELDSLALLFKDDANPSRRLAGLEHLLTCGDPRYRRLVMDEVLRRKEAGIARELALVVAETLPVDQATSLLEELRTVAGELSAAFLTLGHRDGRALLTAYEQHLADDRNPNFRADLITGVGFNQTPEGVEIARFAFEADPSPVVRSRAMFALCANAAEALGERTLQAALDDPEFSRDPVRLGAVVLALQNLERAGLVNAVDRLGQQLRARSDLLPGDRSRLEKILARALPGGETTDSARTAK